jgi:hypothetical protein
MTFLMKAATGRWEWTSGHKHTNKFTAHLHRPGTRRLLQIIEVIVGRQGGDVIDAVKDFQTWDFKGEGILRRLKCKTGGGGD